MSYHRVIPRDLFNESMLLKCLGKVSVMILDEKLLKYGVTDELLDEHSGFQIEQSEMDGSIRCSNYKVYDRSGNEITMFTGLNSREQFPLQFFNELEEDYQNTLTVKGDFSKEFINYLKELDVVILGE